MPEQTLRDLIGQLRTEIDQLPPADEAARDRLTQLIADLETRLSESAEAADHDSLVSSVQESIRQLEVEHPRTTGVLNHIMMTLSNMGI
ncbi:MAG: DUF4404 family protein [Arenicellales bacterium]|jgi:hypothetical protein|nr:hypothetical protein [Acidiferrobacteraceae bacterium]MDP6140451.1 DUF4404 family protein [Arenicellales bacterium]MDP6314450.1 DUF4404 family protein [Arenicellales bacterium]MDP7568723.1 DUF4404 family protein [Arenicellales bacterium]MEE1559391.1 DUF4404 family protein [Arenicellales bacterium]|tara:strand:- start:135 stop:401 length:267 start_codon:yes stop_codon:yes gene_type:complete